MNARTQLDPALFDEDGLLLDFNAWSEELAEALAADAGVGTLSETQWRIIRAFRENYAKSGAAPAMRRVCQDAGVERRAVNELFGYCLVAWRIAGLPNPGEEAKSLLGSM